MIETNFTRLPAADVPTQGAPPYWIDKILSIVKNHERAIILIGIALQIAVLLAMIGKKAWTHATGDVFFVHVQPVDPRDFLRGDYVILNYEFSRVPLAGIEGLPAAMRNPEQVEGRDVYVSLAPEADGKHSHASHYGAEPPVAGPYLRGQLTGFGQIKYDIESFFVQEGQGGKYESAARSNHLTAELSITPTGEAALRNLHIDP